MGWMECSWWTWYLVEPQILVARFWSSRSSFAWCWESRTVKWKSLEFPLFSAVRFVLNVRDCFVGVTWIVNTKQCNNVTSMIYMYFSICICCIYMITTQPRVVSMTFPQYPARSGSPAASGAIGMSMRQQNLGRLKGGESFLGWLSGTNSCNLWCSSGILQRWLW